VAREYAHDGDDHQRGDDEQRQPGPPLALPPAALAFSLSGHPATLPDVVGQ
jgi:hypothetical protein